jgi:hypothetical protein
MLEYKAPRYGRTLPGHDGPVPTDLPGLLHVWRQGRPKPLNVREWTWSACGTVHDRDTNTATQEARKPDRKPCRIAAQQQLEKTRALGLQPEEQVNWERQTASDRETARDKQPHLTEPPCRGRRISAVLDRAVVYLPRHWPYTRPYVPAHSPQPFENLH